jgi:UTP-glucose-1-phosphate uridylyltransferase
MAKDIIKEPFMVINADDFYGKESFEVMAKFLLDVNDQEGKYCMAGYRVGNTLSEHGTVSRGVCATDKMGYLTDVVERTAIENKNGHIVFPDENGNEVEIPFDTPVSMNMWGFTPEYFEYTEEAFKAFLTENAQELKAEFYIPTLVNDMIKSGKATCQVLDTAAKWFGVTYADDRQMVVDKIQALVDAGVYPNKLF